MRYRSGIKKISRRGLAVLLAAAMVIPAGAAPVYGAVPSVEIDETMYVNLDYYGNKSLVNVVKGCNLNGMTEFTDYGNYVNVVNMSGAEIPDQKGDQVTWTLPERQKGRFYYKGTLDESQVELPWNFDVSYKLNGVPAKGEDLAGASGLIEIGIKAEPNERAGSYYRNNMLLMVTVPVDLTKCYSIEAEGAQVQNMGDTTAAVFTALPGEEGDYKVRIGTDSFETVGVMMAMTPGTVKDLEHIKDLKEAKDTWKDAGDVLYDSLEQMARSVEDMRDGVSQVQSGMASAEQARQKWSSSKDSILAGNDQALAALTALSGQMETIVPHLETAKDVSEIVHKNMNDLVTAMGEMQEPLQRLYTRLENIKGSTQAMAEELPGIQKDMEMIIGLDARLQANGQSILVGLKDISSILESIEQDYYDYGEDYDDYDYGNYDYGDEDHYAGGEDMDEETWDDMPVYESEKNPSSESSREAGGSESTGKTESSESSGKTGSAEAAEKAEPSESSDAPQASKEKNDAPLVGASAGTLDMGELIELLKTRTAVLEKVSAESRDLTASMSSLLDNTSDAAKYSSELVDILDILIEDVKALNDSLNMYYPDLQSALDDAQKLSDCTVEALNSGISTLTVVQNTLKDSSNDFDAAARESLRGSMELLDQSLAVLDSTAAMRHAGRTMKDVFDREMDKFDTENRFLFMDPSAPKESFTSHKNKEPQTLQIILRTDEISLTDTEAKTTDAEVEAAHVSPLKRMWNVLVKMWQAIKDIFKNR